MKTMTKSGATRAGAVIVGIAVTLGGCTHVKDTVGSLQTSVAKAFADRGDRYCLQAGGLGAVAGGAAGAGVGYAVTRSTTGTVLFALAGALAAGIAGCKYGVWVAERRGAYDSEQERLNAELANAEETNESLAELNSTLRQRVTAREQQLAVLQSGQVRAQQKRAETTELAEALAEDRKGAEAQLAQAQKELAFHQSALAELEQAGSKSDTGLKDAPQEGAGSGDARLTDTGQPAQQRLEPGTLADYRKRVKEMEQAVAELQGLNQQYANADSRVARL